MERTSECNRRQSRLAGRLNTQATPNPFRVHTISDFRARLPRQKQRETNLACQACRARKVKCVVQQDQQWNRTRFQTRPKCVQCYRADAECKWDLVDGRSRRKIRPLSAGDQQPGQPTRQPTPIQKTPNSGQQGQTSAIQMPVALSSSRPPLNNNDQELRDTEIAEDFTSGNNADTLNFEDSYPIIDYNTGMLPNPIPLPSENDSSGQIGVPHNSSYLANDMYDKSGLAQDWLEFDDLVLGFDFIGDYNASYHTSAGSNEDHPFEDQMGRGNKPVIRLRYYRRFGPTAVIPGLRRLSVMVEPCEPDNLESQPEPEIGDISSPASAISHQSRIFDRSARGPHPNMIPPIFDAFFKNFGGHFPFLHPDILGGHVRAGEASSFLMNAIAALTIRFCPLDGVLSYLQDKYEHPWQRAKPFLKKAKEQLMPLLSVPAPETVGGILILAWAEFGDDNEAGLWMFAGMAIRMAQDLGFHRTPDPNLDPATSFHDYARPSPDGNYILTDEQSTIHQQKARLVMFWSVFIMDVCLSFGTGRPPTIRRSEIEVPIPSAADMKVAQLDFSDAISTKNLVFPETVRLMLHFSEAVEFLNTRVASRCVNIPKPSNSPVISLVEIRKALSEAYQALPPEVSFSTENYTKASTTSQAGLFLTMHLFFYAFIALLCEPQLHFEENTTAADPLHQDPRDENIRSSSQATKAKPCFGDSRASLIASQKILQLLTIAELIDETGYLASPFVNHCLFEAASLLLPEVSNLQTAPGNGLNPRSEFNPPQGNADGQDRHGNNPIDRFPHKQNKQPSSFTSYMADTEYQFIRQKLYRMSDYFGAIRSVLAVLDQKEAGFFGDEMRENIDDTADRIIDLGDPGIVNRYTIP